jgi:hypothetical protein
MAKRRGMGWKLTIHVEKRKKIQGFGGKSRRKTGIGRT